MRRTLRWILASLGLAVITAVSGVQPLRVMSAPNLLRVGSVEKIFVECQDCSSQAAMTVPISAWNFPTASVQLSTTTVTLNADNKFQAFGELVIPADMFDKDNTTRQYVYLRADFPGYPLEKIVLVSLQSGYLFIQTDKTLYTPDSTVHFRIFGLTPEMTAVERDETTKLPASVAVEIVTPEGIVLPLDPVSLQRGMYSGTYRLGDIVSIGQWKVVSRFQSSPQHSYSAEFEVKKYVLPSFEVKLTTDTPFFYYDTESFTVRVTATYLFGKAVDGMAYVVFGVMKDNIKKAFSASLQRVPITEGNGQATLQKEHILRTYADVEDLVGGVLFVTATVHTESGSEMVEGELRNMLIVKSPYFINFDKTPKYFKPGMSFDVTVTVTNPDGTPAEGVPVVVEADLRGTTRANGQVSLAANTRASDTRRTITARTNDPNLPPHRQTSKSMVAKPHQSKGQNFIHINVLTTDVKVGSDLKVHLVLSHQSRRSEITYLILSKGQLIDFGRQLSQEQVTIALNIRVTQKMLPSFRLIVYYHPTASQVVSDSVWVDVEDSCIGTLELAPKSTLPSYEPLMTFELKITGNPGATVGLVAVDKGVYVLNKKHLLTQKKVWDRVEKADPGCTPGGGKNSMGVFFDAGLMFHTDTAAGTIERQEVECPPPAARKRRVATLHEALTTLTSAYQDPVQRECCRDGMKDTLLSYTCAQRSLYITEGKACEEAFLNCCEELAKQRSELKKNHLLLARSEEDDGYLDSSEIDSRTHFPESWEWTTVQIPACSGNPDCEVNTVEKMIPLKDSITTWVFTGISLSKDHGICVGKPLDVVAFKPFFIDLRLPYSAVVGEQIEIRAILHNYLADPVTVRVDLFENEHMCSSASKRGKYTQQVRIGPKTTYAVPFVLIPMKEGELNIEVKASLRDLYKGDGVRKTLRVVPSGVLTKLNKLVQLNPKGGTQELTINHTIPKIDMVPNTPSSTKVFVTGRENISPLVEHVMGASSMGSLIVRPTGCGEQRMTGMTLLVIATTYLDRTSQWEALGLTKRIDALRHMKNFFVREKVYSNVDGAFGVWLNSKSSTWLTAYVARVFSMANRLVPMDSTVICKAVEFLINRAKQWDGRFKEIGWLSHRMFNEYDESKQADASLTAHCLLAMQESQQLCEPFIKTLPADIALSVDYLQRRLPTLTNTYAVAISSYALANANQLNKDILYNFSSPDRTHWKIREGREFSLEATAYALLALVKGNFLEEARPIVRWFTKQWSFGGSYGSTQATVLVYQAVSEYWIVANEPDYNLDIDLQVPGRSTAYNFRFNRDNHYTTRSSKNFEVNQNVKVTARGTGEATLNLVTQYYAVPKETVSDCTKFDLSLDFSLDRIDEKDGDIYKLRMDFFFRNKDEDSSMSILDVTLPTGFIHLNEDLNALSEGHAPVISEWEYNKDLSEKGSIILYLPKVSHNRTEELTFRMRQTHKVGVLQPASVSIYEYYSGGESDDTKCVKFYHPQKKDGLILRRCKDDVCLCAEENCSLQKKGHISNVERISKACESTLTSKIDFVYQVTLENATYDVSFDVYGMRIERVIKEGSYDRNAQGQLRKFLSFPHCRESLDLQLSKGFLIMGTADDTLPDASTQSFEYLLGERTWIEWWPRGEECQLQENRPTCLGMEALVDQYETHGCFAK